MFDSEELMNLASDPEFSVVRVASNELRILLTEYNRLLTIQEAARNLVAQKGRHHTQQAYEKLAASLER